MKNNKSKYIAVIIFVILCSVWAGCDKDKPKDNSGKSSAISKVSVPVFNSDSAYKFVKDQVDFGPRVPNTISHNLTKDYLVKKLESFGLRVKTQEFEAKAFDGKLLKLSNIIASYNPDASQRILLAAHWDTRPFADQDSVDQKKPIDGANDGGSGVGILMEIARTLSLAKEKTSIGVDIILFDGEDYGATEDFKGDHTDTYCLGSQYWAKNKGNYSAYFGVLLDMVGAKEAKFGREGFSMQYAPTVVDMVWNSGKSLGFGSYFLDLNVSPITDDHYYINSLAKIPVIDIIEYNTKGDGFFRDYWHTHNDSMEVIDKDTLKVVGQTLLEVIYNGYKQLM